MARLPTTLGDSLPTPRPQRQVQRYDSQIVNRAMEDAGRVLDRTGDQVFKEAEKNATLEAMKRANNAEREVQDLLYGNDTTPGLYSRQGSAAIGIDKDFETAIARIRADAMKDVSDPLISRALQKSLDDLDTNNRGNIKRYINANRLDASKQLMQDQADLASSLASLEYNNDASFQSALDQATTAGINLAKTNGYMEGDASWKAEIIKQRSKVIGSNLESLAKSNSVDDQLKFMERYDQFRERGELDLATTQRMDALRTALEPQVDALRALQTVRGQQVTYSAPLDDVLRGMRGQESGGMQFGGPGSVAGPNAPTTSPKGAIGIMQVMPATGPEAARMAGLEWDETRYKTDAAYNKQIGEAYMANQVEKFGDVRIALAAYNAGPGIVQDWMDGTNKSGNNKSGLKLGDPRKGETTVDQFLARMPYAETRGYVSGVMRRAGYDGTPNGYISEETAMATAANMREDTREKFLKMVEQNNKAYEATRATDIKSGSNAIIDMMTSNNITIAEVPPTLIAHAQQNGYYEAIKNYDPNASSDNSTLNYLYGLDAKALKSVDLDAPAIRASLSPEDYGRWKQKQNNIDQPAMSATLDLRKTMVEKAMGVRGYEMGGSGADGDENRARVSRVNSLIDKEIDVFSQNNNGRMPGAVELQRIVDNVFIDQKVTTDQGLLWDTDKNIFDISIDDIKNEDVKQIRQTLRSRGLPATDSDIIRAFVLSGGDMSGIDREIASTKAMLAGFGNVVTGAGRGIERGAQYLADQYQMRGIVPKKGVGTLLQESDNSTVRSLGDYFVQYGSIGEDPNDMNESERSAWE